MWSILKICVWHTFINKINQKYPIIFSIHILYSNLKIYTCIEQNGVGWNKGFPGYNNFPGFTLGVIKVLMSSDEM